MADYIPRTDPEKILWLGSFNLFIQNQGVAFGFSLPEIADMNTDTTNAASSVSSANAAQLAFRSAVANKNLNIGVAIDRARNYAQRLQNHPLMTDPVRASAGISIRDTIPTPGPPPGPIPSPIFVLDFGIRRQVTVHWGTNPADERNNARPSGTIGCRIEAARGGIPANEASWAVIETDTESPFVHLVEEATAITMAYRARYVLKNLQMGPVSDPVICTVSV